MSERPNLTPAQKEVLTADYLLSRNHYLGAEIRGRLGKICKVLMSVTTSDEVSASDIMNVLSPLTRTHTEHVDVFIEGYFEHINTQVVEDNADSFFEQKAAAVRRYNSIFAPLIEDIEQDSEHFSSGSNSYAYKLTIGNKTYAVRKIHPEVSMSEVEQHITASLKVADIDRLEHIVAISYEDGVTVAPLLPGDTFLLLESTNDAQYVTEAQLRELYAVMKQGNERGVGFDGLGGNILYDKEFGFSIVDMEELSERSTAHEALLAQLEKIVRFGYKNLDFMYHMDRIVTIAGEIFAEDPDAVSSMAELRNVWLMLASNIEHAEAWLNYQESESDY